MRMESKRSIIWLLIIMILIYIQQSMITYAQEEVTMYKLEISENTGKNGYYVKKPQVKISHSDTENLTKYQLLKGEDVLEEGELNLEKTELEIGEKSFPEGKVLLKVWMENIEGELIPDTETQQVFLIDCVEPEVSVTAEKGFNTWYSGQMTVSVESKDQGSKIKMISCIVDGNIQENTDKEKAEFVISSASIGGNGKAVVICVEDFAGNKTRVERTVYVDQQAPQIEISGVKEHLITNKSVTVQCNILEENLLQEKEIWVEREDEKGRKQKISISKETELAEKEKFRKDGIYRLSIMAKDMAGHISMRKLQFIIDTKKPVVRYVKNMEQKCIQYFAWNRLKKDFITDFTTYRYEIRMDGKLYHLGEKITEEGRHILSVNVIDEAGNCTVENAEFIIDHTGPEIEIHNVEEGESYEKERKISVKLVNEADAIQKIMINGKIQTLTTGKTEYEYLLNNPGDYEIIIEAIDLAGNQSHLTRNFTIEPEKTKIEKMVEPMKKVVEDSTKENEEIVKKIYVVPVLLAVGFLVTVCIVAGIYWAKTREDEEEEED